MYIPEFGVGVGATLTVEVVALIFTIIWVGIKPEKKKGGKK